ncbi:MAG: rhomboid family intramembrane serine protease [Phycisphaerae bacterium]|nr:rhomboid family intramembrane serine protease [Phycisphaerae bacterium]
MGLHDRPYWRDGGGGLGGGGGSRGGGLMIGMPKPGRAVKTLLIINIAVFVLQNVIPDDIEVLFAVFPPLWWQVWRYVTFQFLHAGGWHLAFNMLGLYFLGIYLESSWGSKRFMVFYLVCGAFAGLTHVVMMGILSPTLWNIPLLGASGGVFAIILACAVLFPHIRLILLLFPVPIRFAAALIFAISVFYILIDIRNAIIGGTVGRAISDAAHFGGMVAAGLWIWGLPKLRGAAGDARARRNRGAWEQKLKKRTQQRVEIDRILEKIHDSGINSLTGREKKILRQATSKQQEEERELYRL